MGLGDCRKKEIDGEEDLNIPEEVEQEGRVFKKFFVSQTLARKNVIKEIPKT